MEWIRDTTADLWHILHTNEPKKHQQLDVWKRPALGWIRCNVDGAFDPVNGKGATGVVLRDHNGCFIQGRAVWRNHTPDAITMEAHALKDGLLLAQQSGAAYVCAEIDCLEMVLLWEKLGTQRSAITSILHDVREISRSFDGFSLVYASRTCNRVAHTCARRVSKECWVVQWQLSPPALVNLLADDCNRSMI